MKYILTVIFALTATVSNAGFLVDIKVPCFQTKVLEERLRAEGKEQVAYGLTNSGGLLQVWKNGEEFAIVLKAVTGDSCVYQSGENFTEGSLGY